MDHGLMTTPVAPVAGRPLDWILSIICSGMAREIAGMEERLSWHERHEEENFDALADARRRVRDAQERFERWRWVPLLGGRLHLVLARAREPLRRIKEQIQKERREADDIRKALTKTTISYDMLIMLGEREYSVPDPMPARTKRFLRRFEELNARGAVQENIHELASDLSEILGDWAAASLLYLQSRKLAAPAEEREEKESSLLFDKARGTFVETQAGYVKPIAQNHVMRRIYLPVPRRWEAKMVQAGASIDDSTVNHVMSRVWVGFSEYEKFESYLPRSYRKIPPDLDFESLNVEVDGKPFSFSRRQRQQAIKEMGERQGWRCSLCGSYGGLVWDRLRDMRSSEMAEPLVLRPQWKYMLRDGATGIAELSDLMLICRDCDLAFDDENLERLLVGKDSSLVQRVREHVHRRRMMLLRCEDSVLASRMQALREHLRKFSQVGTWVFELSRLSQLAPAFKDGIVADENFPVAGAPIVSEEGETLVSKRGLEDLLRQMAKAPVSSVIEGPTSRSRSAPDETGMSPKFNA